MGLLFFGCNSKSPEKESQKDTPQIKNKSEIIGNWILNSEFSDSIFIFLKEDAFDTNAQWLKQFTFESDKLSFKHIRIFPICGNGIDAIDSCFWGIENDKIELYLKGGGVGYKFIKHSLYHQEPSSKNQIILVRDSVIKNEFEQLNVIRIQ